MELRHFNPQEEHPISCQRCGHQISGPYYRRQRPRISLHKHCAELSGKNKHPLHQDHTLKLSSSPPKTTNSTDKLKTCNLCHETLYGFTYICSCNDFAIDSVCALMLNKIDHPSHHHQLTPFHNPATFFCHGCRRQRKGISYLCTSCKFWVHQECAWAPSSFRRSDHRHSLTLAYSLPEKHSGDNVLCKICTKTIKDADWVYYCNECSYIGHFHCARSEKKPSNKEQETKPGTDEIESELIQLPLLNQTSVNLITKLIKHSGHPHPLILSDDDKENDRTCAKCKQPLSAPFYKCIQCDFSLHEYCKELLEKILHPCHQKRQLTLRAKSPKPFGIFKCKGCQLVSNSATYSYGNFYLDLSCASLPSKIKHQVDGDHVLALQRFTSTTPCIACDEPFSGFGFTCEEDRCDFTIEAYCAFLPALLPPSAFERYYADEPFMLTYSSIENQEQYYCEVCEEKMNLNWCYYCAGRDRVIHLRCIRRLLFARYSNIKLGGTFNIESHGGHNLTLIRDLEAERVGVRCQYRECGKGETGCLALACKEPDCEYMIHPECALKAEKQHGGVKKKKK